MRELSTLLSSFTSPDVARLCIILLIIFSPVPIASGSSEILFSLFFVHLYEGRV